MTVSSTTNKNTYSGDGAQDTFAYSFPILDETHLLVQIKDTNGTITNKTLTTDYTVTGTGNTSGATDYTSGNIVFGAGDIPAATDTVIIKRNVPLKQETDYVENDPFPAETHEDALDKLTMIAQQLEETTDRTIKFDSGVDLTSFSAEIPAATADKYIKINSGGTAFELADSSTSTEDIEDTAGAMFTGNTETGITATYQDSDGTIDLVVSDTTVAGDSGSTGITPGDTLTIAGGTNATTAMSGDTLTVNVDDAFLSNSGDSGTGTYTITGDLAVDNITINGNSITSTDTNGDINLTPDGTGNVVAGNYTLDADQTVGAGQDNYVLTYDNGTGLISLEASAGGAGDSWGDAVDADIVPDADGTRDLGSTSNRFAEVHADSIELAGTTTVTSIVDEDDMSSDSATALATQQSIKAYADAIPSFKAYRTTSDQTITTGTVTLCELNGEDFDSEGWFDSTTNYRFTPLKAGKYLIVGQNRINALDAAKYVDVLIYKNGASQLVYRIWNGGGSADATYSNAAAIVDMNGSTDYVDLRVRHNHGSDRSLDAAIGSTFLTGFFIGD